MEKSASKKVIRTTFGTNLVEINPKNGLFSVTSDVESVLDTPIENAVGTKKMFLSGSTVEGNLWQEVDSKAKKTRKVVMVQDKDGRYLIPVSNLNPTSKAELDAIEAKSKVEKLGDRVEELLIQAKEEAGDIIDNPKSFLDKEYIGFTGKQIIVASLGIIILIKLFK